MTSPAQLYDLTAAERALSRNKKFRRIASSIRLAIGAASAEQDLLDAKFDLELAARLERPTTDRADARPVGALLTQALILYCRATTTGSDHRARSPVTDLWPPELKQRHKNMMDLRNDAIAHFGPATDHAWGYWAKDALVLQVKPGRPTRYTPLCLRANYRGGISEDLGKLIPAALSSLADIQSRRKDDLNASFTELQADEDLIDLLKRHRFDPFSFFVNMEGAIDYLEQAEKEVPDPQERTVWRPRTIENSTDDR